MYFKGNQKAWLQIKDIIQAKLRDMKRNRDKRFFAVILEALVPIFSGNLRPNTIKH
jgi:hypothetical protein